MLEEGGVEGEERKRGMEGGIGRGTSFFLLKGLEDKASFWESDDSMQREKACSVTPDDIYVLPTCQT